MKRVFKKSRRYFIITSANLPTHTHTGVLGSSRTCLHSILSLVEHSRDPPHLQDYHYQFPKLAQLCYHVLQLMCYHPDLSTPTLRYLRNNHDFFHVQLSHLPVATPLETRGEGPVSLLHQQAGLLQMVAVEMRVTSLAQLRSHAQRLLGLLLDEAVAGERGGGVQRKVLRLLEAVDFGCPPPPPLGVVEFDQKAVERTMECCEMVEYCTGFRYTDVRGLRAVLVEELRRFSGAPTAAQRQNLVEVMVVCKWVGMCVGVRLCLRASLIGEVRVKYM